MRLSTELALGVSSLALAVGLNGCDNNKPTVVPPIPRAIPAAQYNADTLPLELAIQSEIGNLLTANERGLYIDRIPKEGWEPNAEELKRIEAAGVLIRYFGSHEPAATGGLTTIGDQTVVTSAAHVFARPTYGTIFHIDNHSGFPIITRANIWNEQGPDDYAHLLQRDASQGSTLENQTAPFQLEPRVISEAVDYAELFPSPSSPIDKSVGIPYATDDQLARMKPGDVIIANSAQNVVVGVLSRSFKQFPLVFVGATDKYVFALTGFTRDFNDAPWFERSLGPGGSGSPVIAKMDGGLFQVGNFRGYFDQNEAQKIAYLFGVVFNPDLADLAVIPRRPINLPTLSGQLNHYQSESAVLYAQP